MKRNERKDGGGNKTITKEPKNFINDTISSKIGKNKYFLDLNAIIFTMNNSKVDDRLLTIFFRCSD